MNFIGLLSAFFILTSIGTYSHSETKYSLSNNPDNFTEGVWIKKYPYNDACFKFETPDGIKIVCDPNDMDETVSADIVTESHIDGDHTDTSKISGFYNLYRNPGEYMQKGIKITGIRGWHDKAGPFNETNTIFVFDINGIKIAHFASQGQFPDKEMRAELDALNGIDILLIQAYYPDSYVYVKMTLDECCKVIDMLNPKIVIPEHGTPGIGKFIAERYHTQAEHIGHEGIVITKDILKNIKTHRILDMDNGPRISK
jgi:L-ascorbate metabolism protein UlaG (beta-lactamase superfamily)